MHEHVASKGSLNGVEKGSLSYTEAAMPDACIVIPAFNEQKNIGRTLASLAEARRATTLRVRVLIVDNASTDDTAGIAEYSGASVIHEPRKGVARARQAGLEQAEAPIILGTDADSVVPQRWVEAHARHYRSRENVVGVAGGIRYEDNVHPLFYLYKAGAFATQMTVSMLKSVGIGSVSPRRGQSGANFSYLRDEALKIGYPEEINLGEDMLMGMALAERGAVVRDRSPENTVHSDARRFRSASQILELARKKCTLLLKGQLYSKVEFAKDFEDIRE